MYDLLISGGTLIDPSQNINGSRDIAISNGKVVAVEPGIPTFEATTVIDATNRIVAPGLIDAHVHIYEGVSHYGINADATCLAHGATTVVDAGSAGADTFVGFRKYVIEASETRILAQVNISSMGMLSREIGELDDIKWASVPKALQTIEANRDRVLGVKVRLTKNSIVGKTAGLRPLYLAKEAATAAGLPIMVHLQDAWAESIDEVLGVMEGGDMMTHMYHGRELGILDTNGRIEPAVRAARDRGVLFDVGHGEGSFDWDICTAALAQDFPPTTISSDLHKYNVNGPVFDLVTTVSKFLNLGMPLETALNLVTSTPAEFIGMSGQVGTLAVGAEADAVVLELQEGAFEFQDSRRETQTGSLRLAVHHVIKAGNIVPVA